MSVRGKLLFAQAPLAVALIVFAFAAVRTFSSLGAASNKILRDNFRSVLAAQRMEEDLHGIDSAVMFRLAGHPAGTPEQIRLLERKFDDELYAEEHNITEPGEYDTAARLHAKWTSYQAAVRSFLALSAHDAMDRAYFTVLYPLNHQAWVEAANILSINQDAMVQRSARVQRTANERTTLLVVAAVAVLFLGLASSISLTSKLLVPLSTLTNAVRRLGEGDLEARAVVRGEDEIAQLGREFNTMATRLAAYRRSSLGELLEAQQSAQATIDSLPDPVVVFGERGQLLSANEAAADMLGIALEVSTPNPLSRAPATAREVLERLRTHVMGGRGAWNPSGFEAVVRVPAPGGEKSLLPRGTPIYAEEGGIAGAVVVLQDVTRLMFFDEFKNDMVATVAHELRTPLTSLRMAVHLMLEGAAGPVSEKQADLLYTAREETEKLQGIIDDLLDLSRLQGGRLALKKARVTPRELLDPLNRFEEDALGHGLLFVVKDETALGDEVEADADRIGIVLTNLVQNALRHTPSGGSISVRASHRSGAVRFEVSDTGSGIPAEFRDRVFEKYLQIPGQARGEAGLGLYIARELVLAHGGEIGLESPPTGGSTFWFTLPVEPKTVAA